jgi:hypothetical protein
MSEPIKIRVIENGEYKLVPATQMPHNLITVITGRTPRIRAKCNGYGFNLIELREGRGAAQNPTIPTYKPLPDETYRIAAYLDLKGNPEPAKALNKVLESVGYFTDKNTYNIFKP